MKKWLVVRAVALSLLVLALSPRSAFADITCCDLCMVEIGNFHECDGCTITTLGSCQWIQEPDNCSCHLPACSCGGGGGPDCWDAGCHGGLCPENCE